ncbi:hypothetical protein OX283_002730 [Flavobacterium sp. SUN052]|uniref:hypothetical protein n=1 Tax=Flavobacterium sp. SUN052 TaxID=3002441 RepID=UPI00237D8BFD|nr:hypothetical protein [Flavobacterium sp. SUN052]MEC4003561.1 hypothetical protein [Flavobacterium sp. SUN052]
MKTKTIKLSGFTFVLFSCFSILFAQPSVPFKMRYQGFVRGDMTVIANNIVNRVDYNNSSNEPYYNQTNSAKLNDEFNMEYIDIDDDESTFSSSSAQLFFDKPENKKIIYAGLYWSATYKYNAGIQKSDEKFIATDANREFFSTIKLKLPNQENYIDISGQTIFDGLNQKELKDFAPYAVYANITNYLKNTPNPTGVYTVANVKATQGTLIGGVSAGWTIFVVYEDESMTGKFITSYDGFTEVTEKPTDIVFNGFNALPTGNVTAKFACAILEGDSGLIGDELLFSTDEYKDFTSLNSPIRKTNNFFNSSITIENQNFMNRFPDSKNTLGYDNCLFTIPNPNNSVIANNSNKAILRLKSEGDRCFMFFSAFNVDVSPANKSSEANADLTSSTVDKAIKVTTNDYTIKFIPANNDFLIEDYKTTSSFNRISKNTEIDSKNKIIEVQILSVANQSSGYYLIANIFKTEQKALEFIAYLKSKKIQADFFNNTLNNYKYVYLKKVDKQDEVINLFMSKLNDTYSERMQILALNKTNNNLIAESKNQKAIPEKTQEVKVKAPFEIQVVSIPGESKGYYLVANVFSVKENSTNFMSTLKNKGLNPKLLVNKLNDYKYVYLEKVENEQEAINLYLSKINNSYQDKIWILSINNNSQTITSNDD